MKYQIQAGIFFFIKRPLLNIFIRNFVFLACCALVSELAFNETNSYQIVNTNGVYLVASKLLVSQSSSINETELNKEIERLHCNAWRALRILFSAERHRSLIKKIIPFQILEQFVDIGNFKKDLKIYQPLVESFNKITVNTKVLIKIEFRSFYCLSKTFIII